MLTTNGTETADKLGNNVILQIYNTYPRIYRYTLYLPNVFKI